MFPQDRKELRAVYGWVSLSLIVYTALTQVTTFLACLPYFTGNDTLFYNDWYYYLLDAMVFYPAGLLVFWLMLRKFPTPKVAKSPPPGLRQILSCAAVALGVLYGASMVTNLLLADTETVDYANEAVAQEPLGFALLTTVLLAPVCEELIFRRLLLDRLLFLGDWSALLLSALFFGLFHTNLYQFLYAFGVGLVLGYVRIMTGRVSWCILLHMFINGFCGILPTYLPPEDWVDLVLGWIVLGTIAYALAYLLGERPWRQLYPGPTSIPPEEKVKACLTNVTFWICVALHLGLSIYYILP